ncbi:MAG TPA: hypothetical protein VF765_31980 [Polyangiaceae bacterium]
MTDASAPQPPSALVYEVREEVTGALLPAHDWAVTGQCATGSGLAPGSTYAQRETGRGAALGAGVGARAGYLIAVAPPTAGKSSWWGVRATVGLDLALLYGRVDTGMSDVTGQLCAHVESGGESVQYRGSTVFLAQFTAAVGAQVGFGDASQSDGWHGLVFGAAIVPAVTYINPWVAGSSLDASFLGTELTLDFATMQYGTAQEDAKRLSLFLMLPPEDHGAMVATLSFGFVWH